MEIVVNAIINKMFKNVLIENDMKVTREGTTYGYYTHVDRNTKDKFGICVDSCITSGRKIMLGENNSSDSENTYANAISFIYECLYSLFMGELNDRVNKELKCNDVNDIYRILENHMDKLCSYIYCYTRNKFRELLRAKSNPDFYKEGDKFQKNNYLYINDNTNHYEYEIEDNSEENITGDKTEYIIEEYFNKEYLTDNQLQFISDYIKYGVSNNGSILDYDNNVLYTKQAVYKYKKRIRIKLEGLPDFINDMKDN